MISNLEYRRKEDKNDLADSNFEIGQYCGKDDDDEPVTQSQKYHKK